MSKKEKEKDEPEVLTTKEVAALFSMRPHTVTEHVRAGDIKALPLPMCHYRFNKKYIDELYKARQGDEFNEDDVK